MISKLKVVGSVLLYSTSDTWETYKNLISPLKSLILEGKIKIISEEYRDSFQKEYYPCTKEKGWGSNLDQYCLRLDSDFNCELTYYKIDRFNTFNPCEETFRITFKLPKLMIKLFNYEIESKFRQKCIEIREEELNLIEEKRLLEIGKELLRNPAKKKEHSSCKNRK